MFLRPDDFLNYYTGCGADGLGGDGKYIKILFWSNTMPSSAICLAAA